MGELNPGLNDVEKRLICGDKEKNPGYPNEAWKTIPYGQAKYHLSVFLQSRGYLHPVFKKALAPNLDHEVQIGPKATIKEVTISGDGGEIEIQRKRNLIGSTLSPSSLNDLENWVASELQNRGYACPKVTTTAWEETGQVDVKIEAGPLGYFYSITPESIPGTVPGVLSRYYPFRVGDEFRGKLLTLADSRVVSSAVVESAHLRKRCEGERVYLFQEAVPGAPRLLIFGVGINTEGLLEGRASWKNTRLWTHGSLLDVNAAVSKLQNTVGVNLNWFVFQSTSPASINPMLQLTRKTEPRFQSLESVLQTGLATTGDLGEVGATFFIGPTLNLYRTVYGDGVPSSKFLFLEGRATVKTHDYEYYGGNPQKGFMASLTTDFSSQQVWSAISAQRFQLRGEGLWNIQNFDPPLWILGVRGGFTTTVADTSTGLGTQLPASFLTYLGGSKDLRGFGLQDISSDPANLNSGQLGSGGLTSGFVGIEMRLSHTLPYNIDPFLFGDFGATSNQSFALSSPLYWSPGFGVRWQSPIGPVRTTFAQGYAGSQLKEPFHFYFSIGDEF